MLSAIRISSCATIRRRAIHRNTAGAVDILIGYLDTNSRNYHGSQPATQWSTRGDHQDPEAHRICNEKHQGILQIKESPDDKGFGLFASKNFAPGDLVMSSKPALITDAKDSHTVQIDWDRHVLMKPPAVLINHSCNANTGIQNNSESGSYDFFALIPIEKGEELTWDYEASEWDLSTPFSCNCGSPNCRGKIRGFKYHGDIIREQYGEYYADYLKNSPGNSAEAP